MFIQSYTITRQTHLKPHAVHTSAEMSNIAQNICWYFNCI